MDKNPARFFIFSKRNTWIFFGVLASSIVLFSIVALLVVNNVTTSIDTNVLLAIYQSSSSALDTFFRFFTELGGVVVLSVVSSIIFGFLILKQQFAKALFFTVCMGGVMVINLILKSLFNRARPDLWEWIVTETHYSFPSGHATATIVFSLAIVILLWRTKARRAALIAAPVYVVLIGFSRLYLGVHYPTDIIGGWLLGLAWVAAVVLFFQRIEKTKRPAL